MNPSKFILSLAVLSLTTACSSRSVRPTDSAVQTLRTEAAKDPAELYGELFTQVQLAPVFDDSKHFVDMEPNEDPSIIVQKFAHEKPQGKVGLRTFVDRNFSPPRAVGDDLATTKKQKRKLSIDSHIKALWRDLTRQPDEETKTASSLIPLPYPYVVPGGRFREIYYWDSYFTQLGLLNDNEDALFQDMVKNFSHLMMSVGRIPNGNRDYYRGRSQPPFFSYMVTLWAEKFGDQSATSFLPALKKEHEFWMSGERAVRIGENQILNRYWDDKAAPRPEAYKEDVALAKRASSLERKPEDVYRDLRAGAESGWDYSTRWFKDPKEFATIETTNILPIDLNSLMYHLEVVIAELSAVSGDVKTAQTFNTYAQNRKNLIQKLFWNEFSRTFRDYNYKTKMHSEQDTIAMVVPLFAKVANDRQARETARAIESKFLKAGGLVTTLNQSGQQWDAPNGWAPHQWMGYAGLKNYGYDRTAETLRDRWLKLNRKVYSATGKMMEKYNVVNMKLVTGGGEYATQDGFGWTNGVYRALSEPKKSLRHLDRFQTHFTE